MATSMGTELRAGVMGGVSPCHPCERGSHRSLFAPLSVVMRTGQERTGGAERGQLDLGPVGARPSGDVVRCLARLVTVTHDGRWSGCGGCPRLWQSSSRFEADGVTR